jgi:hypothetical protein
LWEEELENHRLKTIICLVLVLLVLFAVVGLRVYQNRMQATLISQYTAHDFTKTSEKIKVQEIEGTIPERPEQVADQSDLLYTLKEAGVLNDERLTEESALEILYKLNPRKKGIYHIGEEVVLPKVPKVRWL